MPLFKRSPPAPPETKVGVGRRLAAVALVNRPRWSGRDVAALVCEGFRRNPIAYRCIRLLAESAASAPLVVFDAAGRAGPDHPLQRLLDRPNPEQSGPDLWEAFYGHLQTAGDAYLEAVGHEAPVELYALRPDRIVVIAGARGWPDAYDYTVEDRTARLRRRGDGFMPVLHLKLFNPSDDYYGFSPLQAAAYAIDIHNASSAWNKALLDNAARPSGALIYTNPDAGGRMTDEQFDRLKTELAEAHSGPLGAGRPLLLEGGLDWRPMALTPAEMDFIQGKHVAAREIALAFGVPPQLLGIPGDATYSTYKEAQAAFWRTAVAPLAERGARALTAWLSPQFEGARVVVDLDRVPALSAEREALWARLDAATFLTPDERRRMAGLEVETADAALLAAGEVQP